MTRYRLFESGLNAAAALLLTASAHALAQSPPAEPPPRPGTGWFAIPPTPPARSNVVAEAGLEPDSPALQAMFEGMLNLQDREFAIGVTKLEKAIELDPSLMGAWEGLGWAYWHMNRRPDALALWERLRKLAPNSPLPLNWLGQAAMAENRAEAAADFFRQSLARDPRQFETRFAFAAALGLLRRTQEALPILAALSEEDPDRADVRIELARNLFAVQRYEEAGRQWRLVCDALPENTLYWIELAQSLLYAGDLENARAAGREAVSRNPESSRALLILADLEELSALPEEAVPTLHKLIELADDPIPRSRLRQRLAGLLMRLHDGDPGRFPLEPVIRETREALKDNPRLVAMRLLLGELLLLKRDFAEAESVFLKILSDFNPQNWRARRGLLELYLVQNRYDEAARMIDALYLNLNEGNPYRYVDLARLENARGNYFEALRLLDRLEREARRGAVLCLGYGQLGATDWEPGLSARLFRDHILALSRAEYTFLTPDQLPAYFESRQGAAEKPPLPLPAQALRWLKGEFSDIPEETAAPPDDDRPDKVVCITFDRGFRTSFRSATPVAEEFGVRFGMHLAAGEGAHREFGIASWEEIRPFIAGGNWAFGSYGLDSAILAPVSRDGYRAAPLPNRLWLKERDRLETQREWSVRLRRELRDSRQTILDQLGLPPDQVRFIAYPGGDIGQADFCNIRVENNVPAVVMNEAGVHYRNGFLPDRNGYAMAADQSLALRRYEPGIRDSGEAVLRHALETHPLMLARKMRAEIAALQGKPYLAMQQLRLLERDGYPPESLETLSRFVRERVSGLLPAADPVIDEKARGGSGLSLSRPFAGIEGRQEQANRYFLNRSAEVRAGVNLAPRLLLEGWARSGEIEQESVSNRWFTILETKVSESRTLSTVVDNGAVTRVEKISRREVTSEVQTNVQEHARYTADYTFTGGRLTGWLSDGSSIEGHAGFWSVKGDPGSDTLWAWGAAHRWKPASTLALLTRYDHDRVTSARKTLEQNAFSLQAQWAPADGWDVSLLGSYVAFSDTNSMLHLTGQSLWLVGERQNLRAGIRAELTTVDNSSIYYWSPYWNDRFYLLARLSRAYPRFFFDAEIRLGLSREKARPEDLETWKSSQVQGEDAGWYPGEKPGSDWEPVVGLEGSLQRGLGRRVELGLSGSCAFYSDYSDYGIDGSVLVHF